MYKQSTDLRFIKNKEGLQRAFIDLTLEKRSTKITVRELADKAGVNRMTFYSHYDEVGDILAEFVDEMVAELMLVGRGNEEFAIDLLLDSATEMMHDEMEFYQLVAQDENFERHRSRFRKGFAELFNEALKRRPEVSTPSRDLLAGMLASGVTYAYLDWLSGAYGELSLEELVKSCDCFVETYIRQVVGQ